MASYLWSPPEIPQPPADFGPGYRPASQEGADACYFTSEGCSVPVVAPNPLKARQEATEPRWWRRTGEAVVIAATALISATLAAQAVRLLPVAHLQALAGWGVFLTLLLLALACAGAEGRRAARGRYRRSD